MPSVLITSTRGVCDGADSMLRTRSSCASAVYRLPIDLTATQCGDGNARPSTGSRPLVITWSPAAASVEISPVWFTMRTRCLLPCARSRAPAGSTGMPIRRPTCDPPFRRHRHSTLFCCGRRQRCGPIDPRGVCARCRHSQRRRVRCNPICAQSLRLGGRAAVYPDKPSVSCRIAYDAGLPGADLDCG